MDQHEVENLARKIWDYHHMHHTLEKSDCILTLGSHDIRVAEKGAQLFIDGWASLLVFSGGLGNLTKGIWNQPEAEKFARVATKMGIARDKFLIENKSTNTGENILFTKKLLAENNIDPQKFIVVHKPYMERRAYATFGKMWPEKDVIVTSPAIPFDEYPTDEIPKDDVINIIVGDLQRIMIYPEKGFQIPQEIPGDVVDAYEKLVKLEFTKHLID